MLVLIYIICSLIGFIFIGAVYQFWSAKQDQRIYLPFGEMIGIKNHRFLHVIRKKISEQGPSVILEAGNGLSSTSWMLVQPEIEKFTNCLSYDRAGCKLSICSYFSRKLSFPNLIKLISRRVLANKK